MRAWYGTRANAISEAAAASQCWNNEVPPTTSLKGVTGHALGASAALEAAITVSAIQANCVPAQFDSLSSHSGADRQDQRCSDEQRCLRW